MGKILEPIMSRREVLLGVAATAGSAIVPQSAMCAMWPEKLSRQGYLFLDDLERQGCLFFREQASSDTGQIRDRARNGLGGAADPRRTASIASTGFVLTAFCVAAQRGYLPCERVTLAPGESKQVSFPLGFNELSFFDITGKQVIEPTQCTVWIGGDSLASNAAELSIDR